MNKAGLSRQLIVRLLSARNQRGVLSVGPLTYPCAIGRGGARVFKREGDGATPGGSMRLLEVFYRADRVSRPRCRLPVRPLAQNDGWCDAVADRNYNRPVRHPYPASAERLWREDRLYDLVVVIDYNLRPRARGRGSAIFMHVAAEGYSPTEGCVALRPDHLRRVIALLGANARLVVPLKAAQKKRARCQMAGPSL